MCVCTCRLILYVIVGVFVCVFLCVSMMMFMSMSLFTSEHIGCTEGKCNLIYSFT